MANATAPVSGYLVSDSINRVYKVPVDAAASKIWTGTLIGRDSTGYYAQGDDTQRLTEIGLYTGGSEKVDSGEADGTTEVEIRRNIYAEFTIATLSTDAGARAEYGKAVSAYYNNQVQLGGGSYGNWVGIIVGHSSVTKVIVHVRELTVAEKMAAMSDSIEAVSTEVGASSTDEAYFDKSITIPGAELKVGDVVKIRAGGHVTGYSGTPTATIKVYLGALQVGTVAKTSAVTNDTFCVDVEAVVRVAGASGYVFAVGFNAFGANGTQAAYVDTTALASINTTGAQIVRASNTFNASHSSNKCVLDFLRVQVIRQAA